jgi:hypothetical protein
MNKLVKQNQPMTRTEQHDLMQVARMRAKVVRAGIATAAAKALADVEAQLAAVYSKYDAAWADLVREAERKVEEVDQAVLKRFEATGVPKQFHPRIDMEWYGRGENAIKERRAELRRVAEAQIAARVEHANHEVLRRETEILTEIVGQGLTSEAAQQLFVKLPKAEDLIPRLQLDELEKRVPLLERD